MKYNLPTILLVGPGSMGMAIISGLILKNSVNPAQIHVHHPKISQDKKNQLNFMGITVNSVPRDYDIVIIALKPDKIDKIKEELQILNYANSLFISVAAGFELSKLIDVFGSNCLRMMPNIPIKCGEGVNIFFGKNLQDEQKDVCNRLFGSLGLMYWVKDELLFDKIMAVSGCGPAFILKAVESLEKAAIEIGIEKGLAKKLARQTFIGVGELAKQEQKTIQTMICEVASKGGATQAGLTKMQKGLETSFKNAVQAALARYSK